MLEQDYPISALQQHNCLIIGYFGYGLSGDEAVLEVMVRQLRERFPSIQITVTSKNPSATAARYEVEAVQITSAAAVLAAIEQCHIVLVGGGGVFNEYAPFEPFRNLAEPVPFNTLCCEAPIMAKMLGKKCVVFAAGVEPLHSEAAKTAVREAFEACDAVVLRDSSSVNMAAAIGFSSEHIMQSCDPAWALNDEVPEREGVLGELGLRPDRTTLIALLRHWDLTPLRLSKERQAWETACLAGLKSFCQRHDAQIVFLPSQAEPGSIYSDDALFASRLRDDLENVPSSLWTGSLAPSDLIRVIACGDVALAMRHHGVIFSLVARLPTVALSYSQKVTSVIADACLGEWALPLSELTADDLTEALSAALTEAPALASKIPQTLRERKEAQMRAIRTVETVITAPARPASEAWLRTHGIRWLKAARPGPVDSALSSTLETILGAAASTDEGPAGLAVAAADLAQRFPGSSTLEYYAGFLAWRTLKDFDAAERHLNACLQFGHPPEWPHYWLSQVYTMQGKPKWGRRHLRLALESNPDFILARQTLAEMEAQDHEGDTASDGSLTAV